MYKQGEKKNTNKPPIATYTTHIMLTLSVLCAAVNLDECAIERYRQNVNLVYKGCDVETSSLHLFNLLLLVPIIICIYKDSLCIARKNDFVIPTHE